MNGTTQPQTRRSRKVDIVTLIIFLLILSALTGIVYMVYLILITVQHIDTKTVEHITAYTRNEIDTSVRNLMESHRRNELADWLTEKTQNREVTERMLSALYNSNVPVLLYFALIDTESSYNPNAKASNKNGTIDIGIGQLNSYTYAQFPIEMLFDVGFNLKKSVEHLEHEYSYSLNWTKAVIRYNCGTPATVPWEAIDYYNAITCKEERLIQEYAARFLE